MSRSSVSTKLISSLMSVVLVVGLMPVPAYGETGLSGASAPAAPLAGIMLASLLALLLSAVRLRARRAGR